MGELHVRALIFLALLAPGCVVPSFTYADEACDDVVDAMSVRAAECGRSFDGKGNHAQCRNVYRMSGSFDACIAAVHALPCDGMHLPTKCDIFSSY